MVTFLKHEQTKQRISEFCCNEGVDWKFIPERAPHFGGLWEAAVKSMKLHLRRVIGEQKYTFEEYTTLLSQVEACLNSRPLTSIPGDSEHCVTLTPGHFLIGKPLQSLPDPPASYQKMSTLRRWHLIQSMVRHFWSRWSSEYLTTLRKFSKVRQPGRNLQQNDIVVMQEENLVPTKWQLARVVDVHPGNDGIVRVATVKTSHGIYKRPVVKLALLLPQADVDHLPNDINQIPTDIKRIPSTTDEVSFDIDRIPADNTN